MSPTQRTLTFTVPGRPVPKGRPRFARGHAYTPKKTRDAEAKVKALALVARQEGPRKPFSGHIGVSLVFWVAPGRRVDIDNLIKTVFDSCNGVLWDDDSQVSALTACRVYGSPERTDVTVQMLMDDREA